jgi:recombination associated protein RdgC
MWFNNALIYRYEYQEKLELNTALAQEALKPCSPHARLSYGWLPFQEEQFAHELAGCSLITLGKEERILPRAVILQQLAQRVAEIEQTQARELKRSERTRLCEDIEFELLPKAFCLQKKTAALFDHLNQHLYIQTTSAQQAGLLIDLLRKCLPSMRIEPVQTSEHLALRFVHWMTHPVSLPHAFQLASDCLLFSPEDEKKRFHCKGCELPSDEIQNLIRQGLAAAEVSLIWQERIQFTLTQDFSLKRIRCLDYLIDEMNDLHQLEEEQAQQDASLMLIAGELRALTKDLLAALAPVQAKTNTVPQELLTANH